MQPLSMAPGSDSDVLFSCLAVWHANSPALTSSFAVALAPGDVIPEDCKPMEIKTEGRQLV